MAAVTVILSTYGRPDTLACAVQSVLHQTQADWRLLIIGDCCGEETSATLAPFLADSRIRYVNLPWRCGEQAQLNSAGIASAASDKIAFLNHDDLWLPSHLAAALDQLKISGANFFFGRSAWIWKTPENLQEPLALETISPIAQDFPRVFTSGIHCVEPASAWVTTRELAQRIGPWHSSSLIFRSPIQDWFLRAYRSGAQVTPGNDVTCLKFENQWSKEAPARKYDTPATAQKVALNMMGSPTSLDALHSQLRELANQPQAIGRGMDFNIAPVTAPRIEQIAKLLITEQAGKFYLQTGLDAYSWLCAEAGLPRGWRWQWALQQRTGETPITPPQQVDVAKYVQSALSQQGWS
ncbi:MAG: glycosyltransferase family 2 protein [Proteobacteria bacterium]|nr:glycosyltransferase family 2 protein [Pseudomonadota bacterium]MBS0495272.1 glycosyltransferase family 2 protein [Pseudomonadota bacterium]